MKNYDIVKLDPVNNYFIFTLDEIKELKQKLLNNEVALQQLKNFTEEIFAHELETVVSKEMTPPSNNKHDYVSLATYWWPNKDTKNGLPYVQKDGYANPEGAKYDKDKFRRLAYITYNGALLYYITEDKKYYELIEKHLKNWFIDDNTKMNPNMNFGQFIPGITNGRREGIIDYTANFMYALSMLNILKQNGMIEENLLNELIKWHTEFKKWLLTSNIGIHESQSENNHGTMYYLGLIIISEFIDDTNDIDAFIQKSNEKMLLQVDEDYKLPLELKRTKSLSYTLMCYKGLLDTLRLSLKYENNINKSVLEKVAAWMKPYYNENKKWPYTQVTQYDKALNIYFAHSYKYISNENLTYQLNENEAINKIIYYLFM